MNGENDADCIGPALNGITGTVRHRDYLGVAEFVCQSAGSPEGVTRTAREKEIGLHA